MFRLFPGSPYIRAIGTVNAVAGHDVTLHCPYSGYPISAISWERRGQELPVDLRRSRGEGGSLTISRVDPAVDAGSYVCSVRGNSGELARREVQLSVNSEYVTRRQVCDRPTDRTVQQVSKCRCSSSGY
jgi:hypothetical protein